jgi:hypothetical protein
LVDTYIYRFLLNSEGIHLLRLLKFCENPGIASTNRKFEVKIYKGIVHALPVFKRFFANSKAFAVEWLRTYKFKILMMKREFKRKP